MSERVRFVKSVSVSKDLPFPAPTILRDGFNRIEKVTWEYTSIDVVYDVTWDGDSNTLSTYTRTITDK